MRRFYMGERLLEFLIYVIAGMICILIFWAIFRELFGKFNRKEQKKRALNTKHLFKMWVQSDEPKRRKIVGELKAMGDASYLEPFFFELYEGLSKSEQQDVRPLFELIGIQEFLRKTLLESSDIMKREKAALKLGQVGIMQDIPILLDVIRDPEEKSRVKECVSLSLYDLSKELLSEHNAAANAQLLVQLLEVPNELMRHHIAKTISELPMPKEDLIPHLLKLEQDYAKQGALMVFEHWDEPKYSSLLMGYLDDLLPMIRSKAIFLLGRWQKEDSLFMLFKKLNDPDPSVRVSTIEALSLYDHSAVKAQFKKHLDDPHPNVQMAYLIHLAHLKDQQCFEIYIQCLNRPGFKSVWVSRFMGVKKEDVLESFNFIGLDERIFMGKVGWAKADLHEGWILTALESPHADLRKKALLALKILQHARLEGLSQQILQKDPDGEVRHTAQDIINQIKKGVKS